MKFLLLTLNILNGCISNSSCGIIINANSCSFHKKTVKSSLEEEGRYVIMNVIINLVRLQKD